MDRSGVLLLCLCLLVSQSRTEELPREPMEWMRKMELAPITRNPLLPSELIQGLENSLLSLNFSASNVSLMTDNIHSLAFKLNCAFAGLSLSSTAQKHTSQARAQHAMQFPAELTQRACKNPARDLRLICIYFFNNFFFHISARSGGNTFLLNNYILGARLGQEQVKNLNEPINISFWHNHSQKDYIPTCVFWKENMSRDNWGFWSSEGCRTEQPSSSQVLCRCSHLTYFAVLMQIAQSTVPEKLLNTLTTISIVGCSISVVASLLSFGLHFHNRKQKDATTRIHMNLLASVLFLNVAFLLSPTLAGPSVPRPMCTALAAILHWALLSCFTWMAIEGFNLYIFLGRVYNTYFRRYVLKLCLVGWGLPTFLVLLLLASEDSVYGRHQVTISDSPGNSTGLQSQFMCWLQSNTVHAVLVMGYSSLTCLFNLAVLVWVQWLLCRLRARTAVQGTRACQDTVTVLGLTVLLGTTWVLGFFSYGVFLLPQLFLFTIFNSLYGFFLFLWFWSQKSRSAAGAETEMETFNSSRTVQ